MNLKNVRTLLSETWNESGCIGCITGMLSLIFIPLVIVSLIDFILSIIAPDLLAKDMLLKAQLNIQLWLSNINFHNSGDLLAIISIFLGVPSIIGKERLENWDQNLKAWIAGKSVMYIVGSIIFPIYKLIRDKKELIWVIIIPTFLIGLSRFFSESELRHSDLSVQENVSFFISAFLIAGVFFVFSSVAVIGISIIGIIGLVFIIFSFVSLLFPVLLMPYKLITKLGAQDSLERTLLFIALIAGILAYWINK